jgi:hypothetical protein
LSAGQRLRVTDPEGEQVADLVAFARGDSGEWLSSGRTFDYQSSIRLTTGDRLWSNRSRVLLVIEDDTVGLHDFLLAPCSAEMFRLLYGHDRPARGCFGNLAAALAPHGIAPDAIPTAFNCFMNVPVGPDGKVEVLPPISRAGDHILFRAETDLLIGLTACSAPNSNNGRLKPVAWEVLPARDTAAAGAEAASA